MRHCRLRRLSRPLERTGGTLAGTELLLRQSLLLYLLGCKPQTPQICSAFLPPGGVAQVPPAAAAPPAPTPNIPSCTARFHQTGPATSTHQAWLLRGQGRSQQRRQQLPQRAERTFRTHSGRPRLLRVNARGSTLLDLHSHPPPLQRLPATGKHPEAAPCTGARTAAATATAHSRHSATQLPLAPP